jgi:hypothetical protein
MQKTRKYEGKLTVALSTTSGSAICGVCQGNLFPEELPLSFILAGKSFSEMFTTYSHAPYSRPRQRA